MRQDLVLLLMRVSFGGLMAINHGLPKLMNYSEKMGVFSDPLGIGSAASLALVIFAEFFCSIAVMFGLFTRLSAIPVLITMLVAFFVIHGGQGWDVKEAAFIFATAFLCITIGGGGKFSLDYFWQNRQSRPSTKRLATQPT